MEANLTKIIYGISGILMKILKGLASK